MRIGEDAFGKFRIDAEVGRARSITTFAATSLSTGEAVVLTTATRARADDALRVGRAVEILVPIQLPRIARVVAGGAEGSTAWAASLAPSGTTLRAHLSTVRGIDTLAAIEIAVSLLEALERDDGAGTFAPVVRPNGDPIATTSTDAWIDLRTTPTYTESERVETRTFSWTVSYPVRSRAGSSVSLEGTYRFRVHVPANGGDLDVMTDAFTVTP